MEGYNEIGSATSEKKSPDSLTINGSDWPLSGLTNVVDSDGILTLDLVAILDDFERANLDPYSGATASFEVTTTSPVQEGSYSLKGNSSGSAQTIDSWSGGGLEDYPAQGDTWEYYVYNDGSGAQAMFSFGVPDGILSDDDSYRIFTRFDVDDFLIQLRNGSGGTTGDNLAQTSVTWPTDDWLRVEIGWETDGTITGTVEDSNGTELVSETATDSTFTDGGIGWSVNTSTSSASAMFDGAKFL
ncbi:hypothetical protein ACFQO4_20560 [Saliphagus sp. GCM10025334]